MVAIPDRAPEHHTGGFRFGDAIGGRVGSRKRPRTVGETYASGGRVEHVRPVVQVQTAHTAAQVRDHPGDQAARTNHDRREAFGARLQHREEGMVPVTALGHVCDLAFLDSGEQFPGDLRVPGVHPLRPQSAIPPFVPGRHSRPALEPGIHHRDSPHTHVVQAGGIIGHAALGPRPERRGALEELVGVPRGCHGRPDPQHVLRGCGQRLQLVKVRAHGLGGRAVVPREEVVVQRFDVLVRIPQQLGQYPGPKFGELGVRRLVGALLEEADDAVVAEELHVALQASEVGVGPDVVPEVGGVVPDVELVRDGGPAFDVLHELHVLGVWAHVQRQREVALDAAQTGDHVAARAQCLGRGAGVLVGESLDPGVRELLLDRLGNLVHEVDQGPGRRTLTLVDGPALRAGAVAAPVILADAEQLRIRVLPDPVQHTFGHDPDHVRVRQAQLGVVRLPLAADLAVVLRVRGKELVWGHEPEEGVDEQPAAETYLTAVFLGELHPVPVGLAAGGKVALEHHPPERLAHDERGRLRLVQCRHGPTRLPRNDAAEGGVPTAAPVPFEQFVDPVKRTAYAAADDQEVLTARAQGETVVTQRRHIRCLTKHSLRVPSPSEKDRLGGQGPIIRHDRQLGARHLFGESLQFLGSIDLRR